MFFISLLRRFKDVIRLFLTLYCNDEIIFYNEYIIMNIL